MLSADDLAADFTVGDANVMSSIVVYGNTLGSYHALATLEAKVGLSGSSQGRGQGVNLSQGFGVCCLQKGGSCMCAMMLPRCMCRLQGSGWGPGSVNQGL